MQFNSAMRYKQTTTFITPFLFFNRNELKLSIPFIHTSWRWLIMQVFLKFPTIHMGLLKFSQKSLLSGTTFINRQTYNKKVQELFILYEWIFLFASRIFKIHLCILFNYFVNFGVKLCKIIIFPPRNYIAMTGFELIKKQTIGNYEFFRFSLIIYSLA